MIEGLAGLFANGRIVDAVLALVALEAVALVVLHRGGVIALQPAAILPNLAAGACLLLALRAALSGAGWVWIALSLMGALAAHVTDLAGAIRRAPIGRTS